MTRIFIIAGIYFYYEWFENEKRIIWSLAYEVQKNGLFQINFDNKVLNCLISKLTFSAYVKDTETIDFQNFLNAVEFYYFSQLPF